MADARHDASADLNKLLERLGSLGNDFKSFLSTGEGADAPALEAVTNSFENLQEKLATNRATLAGSNRRPWGAELPTEVLENILSFLDTRELRGVLGVSRRFQDVVAQSTGLRRTLCVEEEIVLDRTFLTPFPPDKPQGAGAPKSLSVYLNLTHVQRPDT